MTRCPDIPVYLERVDPARGMARFYAITVEPTLFGDWTTVYRWGRIGTAGQRQETGFATREAALDAARTARARKWRRGYRLPERPRPITPRPATELAASAPPRPVPRSQYALDLD